MSNLERDAWVPTDAEVREQFLWEFDGDREKRAEAAFDRWLVSRDRRMKAEALEEAAATIHLYPGLMSDKLRARAAELREEIN